MRVQELTLKIKLADMEGKTELVQILKAERSREIMARFKKPYKEAIADVLPMNNEHYKLHLMKQEEVKE